MAQIECKNVKISYGQKEVFNSLNFSVSKGDYLCVVGENGAGKSSLLRAILGLDNNYSGEILFGDKLTKQKIGYLPQSTLVQKDFPASAWEIVLSGCVSKMGFRPFYSKQEKMLAYDSMEKLGILDLQKKCFRELSGGQQQKVLLARALCSAQDVLILDEPVSGLDVNATKDMYRIIEHLNKVDKITIIMITHDIKHALKYATHVLHVKQKPYFATVEEYKNSETFLEFDKKGQ